MQLKYTIDRFEADFAVCETNDHKMVNIPFEDIPANSVEGDILKYVEGRYVKDTRATAVARHRIRVKMEKLIL